MKECHVCLYMCEDTDEICPICGAELRAAPEQAEEPAVQADESAVIVNPVLAASADSPVTAEIFKDILAENGIAYSVDEQGDIMHTGFGGSYFAVDIYVDEKDVDIAKELYRNLSESEADFGEFEDFDGFDDSDGEEA
ncbi:MAG: DUF2007 domain-containing protein [Clostridia bacterium]|nr:DUF2007 domain-containing protein [Clostridia bacterium]